MKRNKISRLLAVSMSVCLLAAGVTGCSSSQEDSADQTAEENTSETEGDRDPCGSGSQPGVRL